MTIVRVDVTIDLNLQSQLLPFGTVCLAALLAAFGMIV
jgi:hypothetical protein